MLVVFHMTTSAFSMMGFIIVSSMIADIVEEIELTTGQRSEGLLFAADTFLQKVTTGVAAGIPGWMLLRVGLPVGAHPKTVDPHIMIHLAELYLPVVTVLMLCSTTCIAFYRIDRSKHQENLRRIADAAAIAELGQEALHQPLDPAA
jgi:Na+/melibiose symporter-like transporter